MPKPSGQRHACCHHMVSRSANPLDVRPSAQPSRKTSEAASEPPPDDLLGTVVGRTYLIGHVIGKGSFGAIRLCNPGRPQHFVVAKVEMRREGRRSRLYDEFNILQELQGAVGFPKVYYFTALACHNVMILDMLGPTLEELMHRVGGVFSVKTVALIGLQLMDRMEFLHKKDILYRDVKGENLLIGLFDHHNRVYLVDFGLCKHVLKEDGDQYNPVGTPRYMSLRTHEGRASSFRDDIESVGYLLIYFALGRLPWQGLPAASTDTKISMIGERKNSVPLSELCKGLPSQLINYLQAARRLRFNELPDYNYFRSQMRAILRTCSGPDNRLIFDWQRPGIKLTVLPKVTQPTAISQKHEVLEQAVVDLRQTGKDTGALRRASEHKPAVTVVHSTNTRGSLSYTAAVKQGYDKRKPVL